MPEWTLCANQTSVRAAQRPTKLAPSAATACAAVLPALGRFHADAAAPEC